MGGDPARASFQPGDLDRRPGDRRSDRVDPDLGGSANPPRSSTRRGASGSTTSSPTRSSRSIHGLDACSMQIRAPFDDVAAFTIEGDTLWVTGEDLAKIDLGLDEEVEYGFEPPRPTHGVVVAEGSLWVTMPAADTTLRLDPCDRRVEHRFADLPGSVAIAYGDGSVWTSGWTAVGGGFTAGGGMNRIDPDANTITKTPLDPVHWTVAPSRRVAAPGGRPTRRKASLYKVDQSGRYRGDRHRTGRVRRVIRRRHRLGRERRRRHRLGGRRHHRCTPNLPVRASGPRGRGRVGSPPRDARPGANVRGCHRRARWEGG